MEKATKLQLNFFNQVAQVFKDLQNNLAEVFENAGGNIKENCFEIPGDYDEATEKGRKLISTLPSVQDTSKVKRLKAIEKCAKMYKAVAECNAISREITDLDNGANRYYSTRQLLAKIDTLLTEHMEQYMKENTIPEMRKKGLEVNKSFWLTVAYREYYSAKHRNED